MVFAILGFSFVVLCLIGVGNNLYDDTKWYDKLMHFFFGFLTTTIGHRILIDFNPGSNFLINALFSISFSILIGFGWEIIEFVEDKLLKTHNQHVLDTGVDDTMYDLMFNILGGVIAMIIILLGFIIF